MSLEYAERFQDAADAAQDGSAFEAITALLGPQMDDHEPISGDVTVGGLSVYLDDEQMSALGIEDAHDQAIIVGYNTDDGFALKTAEPAEVLEG